MLDLKQLSLENVELLQRMVPTEQETKAYREYINEKKNINMLTEEDKFLLQLTKVERISAKLSIMSYIGNFYDNLHLIAPVFNLFFFSFIFIFSFYFIANTRHYFWLKFREKFEEIEISLGSDFSLWELFKQL